MTLLVLQAAAITLVFTRGSLFQRIRAIYPPFLSCPLCVGVWVGLGHAVAQKVPETAPEALEVLGIGALTGVLALLAHALIELVEVATNRLER